MNREKTKQKKTQGKYVVLVQAELPMQTPGHPCLYVLHIETDAKNNLNDIGNEKLMFQKKAQCKVYLEN